LAEVVARYDRAVILGDPGSGKSTLLRYLAPCARNLPCSKKII